MIFSKGCRENSMLKSVYPENHAYPALHMGKIELNLLYYNQKIYKRAGASIVLP
jgi:hypothetical protein